MGKKRSLFLFAFCLALGFSSCKENNAADEPTDTPTSGSVKILTDEGFKLLFDTEVDTFESLYPNATVQVSCGTEEQAIKALLSDSVKVAVLGRTLSKDEMKLFKQHDLFPVETKFAVDAIAFVVNKDNADSTFTQAQIQDLLTGKDSMGYFQSVVFDHPNSANYHYLQAVVAKGKPLGTHCFAVESNPAVVDYVAAHPHSLGVVSFNWLSDKKDSATIALMKKVKIAGIEQNLIDEDSVQAKSAAKGEGKKGVGQTQRRFIKPYQAYISTKEYPYTREVYLINRQTRNGLGRGFVAFVAGDVGQRIVLKMGLLPAIMPTRLVEMNYN